MNCATHNDVAAVAFCRTCGMPLCQTCTRDVRGVIYCESCLAARLDASAPAAGFVPPTGPQQTGYQPFTDQGLGVKVQPGPASGPNPTVAGILGAIPLGLGAVYCGQYAKGLVHLGIFVLAIVGFSYDLPWQGYTALGIFLGFFWMYQILDAVRTAKAIQAGEPTPDPFGLTQTFGTGDKIEATKVPTAAAVLIGLGVIFLLHTAGLFRFSFDRFWPLILVFLGVWMFARNWGLIGGRSFTCQCERCRTRRLMGPAILVTLGIVFLIGFGYAWPAILLVIGVVKLMQSNASYNGHLGAQPFGSTGYPPPGPPPPSAPASGVPTAANPVSGGESSPSGEVKNV
jgi:hypothetical protein